jgi:O-antigen/teichoic acid export membrane protein
MSVYRSNVIANYAAVLLSGLFGLLLMPVYARMLGHQQWGVVSLCLLIQNVLVIADLGLAQTMPRDVAQATVRGGRDGVAVVLSSYMQTYFSLALVLSLLGIVFIPIVVEQWFFDASAMPGMSGSARLAVLCAAVQLANSASLGYWSGSQQQAMVVRRTSMFLLIKHTMAIGGLMVVEPVAVIFMFCQLAGGAIEWLANMRLLKQEVGSTRPLQLGTRSRFALLRRNRAIVVSVVIGALVSQIDRIVLSREISASAFGVYAILLSLGLAFMQLQYPLMTAIYPRVALDSQRQLLLGNLKVIGGISVLPCLLVMLAAEPLISIYLREMVLPLGAMLAFRLILLSVALNAIYHVFHQYMVVANAGRWLVITNLVSLFVATVSILTQVNTMGLAAGGLAWFGASLTQVVSGLTWAFLRKREA